jgi:ribosomal-protein-alanine N-acetyltransferase
MQNRVEPSMTISLETARLIFRDWTTADLTSLHAICSDPAVMQFVGDGEPWSLERTAEWIEQACELATTSDYCRWALVLKETSTLIGFCGFVPANNGAEIGWRLARDAWGRGLATEAARQALDHGFDVLGFQRVIATVQSPNRSSIRVCEKLGMKAESSFLRNGREVLVYSISAGR